MFWLQILSLTDWMFCKHMGARAGLVALVAGCQLAGGRRLRLSVGCEQSRKLYCEELSLVRPGQARLTKSDNWSREERRGEVPCECLVCFVMTPHSSDGR